MWNPALNLPTVPVAGDERLANVFARVERAAQLGYWRYDVRNGGVEWSPGMFALLGLDPRTATADNEWLVQQVAPEDHGKILGALQEAMATKAPFSYRVRLAGPGRERYFDTFGDIETDSAGTIVAIIGVVQDATAAAVAETALQLSENQFRLLAENASDMLSRHGSDGRCLYISPASAWMLGYEPAELAGYSTIDLVVEGDRDRVMSALSRVYTAGESVSVTYRVRHRKGHLLWLETTARPAPSPDGSAVTEMVGVTRDVTARHESERALRLAQERAEAANRTKSRFLANMSHELRTPLNAIIGFSDIMTRGLFGPLGHERYTEYAGLILDSGRLLLDLINDILDMSKIEAGKYDLQLEAVDAGEIVRQCVRMMQARAQETGIRLRAVLPDLAVTATLDRRAVTQILLNLLSNAMKFTPAGGEVTVALQRSGRDIVFSVSDTGIGIAPQDLPRLGRPFEQVNADVNLAKAGTGLGLALVKALTQLHGGDMRIRSTVGEGTTVMVQMPVTARSAQSEAVA